MKSKKQLSVFFTIFIVTFSSLKLSAQDTEAKPSLDNGPIESQFNYLITKSSTYQDYKVVKTYWLTKLKSNVTDSLNNLQKELKKSQKTIFSKSSEIDSLQSDIRTSNDKLTTAIREKNTLRLLGLKINKTAYNSIMWSILGILTFFLLVFFALYKRSNTITVQVKKDLAETKEDYQAHRKRAREREERLVHDLHAEKNKNKMRQL